jgi:hypothetical protein
MAAARHASGDGCVSTLACPRCRAHVVSGVVHLEDTPDGLYAVTDEPVADYVHECPCGADIAVSSTQSVQHHPGQLRLVTQEVA